MSEQKNIFEAASNTTGGVANPFASAATDPFGYKPPASQNPTPAPDLGSQLTAPNPLESPAATPAGTQAVTKAETPTAQTAAPIIDLGSQPGTESAFPALLQTDAPKEDGGSAAHLQILEPPPKADTPDEGDEIENPIAAAMAEQDRAEQQSIFAKPPIFEHGAVKEPIEDLNQTFDELRIAKSDDFPELEDAVRVEWEVTYGKIRKTVPTPKKTKIGEYKKQIEASKEFMDALKKDKNKSPDCIIKPRVKAQSKGDRLPLPTYKGVYTNLEDAENSGKAISIVPGRSGFVYEIRREEMGTFITPSGECKELSEIQAGFSPALPPVPRDILLQIIGFFRSVMIGGNYEAIANIFWDRENMEFITVIPKQRVTAVRAESELSDEYDPERYLHYMDVHSHNVMQARFSAQDDADEKATRLYAVIGKLNEYIPEMSVRMSNGGKYLPIDPSVVFESLGDYYPVEWNDQVSFGDTRTPVMRKPYECDDDEFIALLECLNSKGRAAA